MEDDVMKSLIKENAFMIIYISLMAAIVILAYVFA